MKMQHVFFDLDNTLWDHRRNAYLTIKDLFEKQEITLKYHIDFEEFHSVYHDINEELWEKIRDGKSGIVSGSAIPTTLGMPPNATPMY